MCLGLLLCVCSYANTKLFWLLCTMVWNQEVWCLQLCLFSRLLWLFGVFRGFIWVLEDSFYTYLWEITLEFWKKLHWLCSTYICTVTAGACHHCVLSSGCQWWKLRPALSECAAKGADCQHRQRADHWQKSGQIWALEKLQGPRFQPELMWHQGLAMDMCVAVKAGDKSWGSWCTQASHGHICSSRSEWQVLRLGVFRSSMWA